MASSLFDLRDTLYAQSLFKFSLVDLLLTILQNKQNLQIVLLCTQCAFIHIYVVDDMLSIAERLSGGAWVNSVPARVTNRLGVYIKIANILLSNKSVSQKQQCVQL